MSTSYERTIDALLDAARNARDHAYARYSNFRVGAAVLASDGNTEEVFHGCNVENAAYGSTMCAERNAVAAAVAAGFHDVREILIYTDAGEPTPPCGACRQVLHELGPTARVHLATPAGVQRVFTLPELFPHPFGPESLST